VFRNRSTNISLLKAFRKLDFLATSSKFLDDLAGSFVLSVEGWKKYAVEIAALIFSDGITNSIWPQSCFVVLCKVGTH
jgi:hypothetical protein